MRALRIAMVVPDFPRVGGYERQAVALCHQLRAMGHEPYLVTNVRPGRDYEADYEGIELVALSETPKFREHPFLFVRAFLKHLKRRPTDCVHAHAMSPFSSAAIIAAKSRGVPTILKLAGVGDEKVFRTQNDLNFKMARRGPLVAEKVVTLCNAMDRVAQTFGAQGTQMVRIPNGVSMSHADDVSLESALALKRSLKIPDDHRIFLYVGRLSEEKGLRTLFQAVLPSLKREQNRTLVVVGDGPMRAELESMSRDFPVKMVGFQKKPAFYYRMADLFLLPSHEEGMSNALLEAMAVGLPIVTTDVGAAKEMLGRHYPLVRPKDELEFRLAVESIEARLAQGEPIGKLLQERCQDKFSLTHVAQCYVDLYRSLMTPGYTDKASVGWMNLLRQLKGTLLESES